ncbi:MAG: hypothetical protein A2033_13215 [Bacteroidetes bacterium GWA2_31_9]|nr:MAG: hypothetical protein A2033_13215 [Bacteroidetes bacterium GWA2_31_9]
MLKNTRKTKLIYKLLFVYTCIIIFIATIGVFDYISQTKSIKTYSSINNISELSSNFQKLNYMFNSEKLTQLKIINPSNHNELIYYIEKHKTEIPIISTLINKINNSLDKLDAQTVGYNTKLINEVINKSATCFAFYNFDFIPAASRIAEIQINIFEKKLSNDSSSTLSKLELHDLISEAKTIDLSINSKSEIVEKEIENIISSLVNLQSEYKSEIANITDNKLIVNIVLLSIAILFSIIIAFLSIKLINTRLKKIKIYLNEISVGNFPEIIKCKSEDEIGDIINSISSIKDNLKNTHDFAISVGSGKFDKNFTIFNETGQLGKALLEMREGLQTVTFEREKQEFEEKRRNWATEGFAIFGEILRQNNDDLEKLSFNIIKNLVQFMGINQGGIFMLNDDENDKYLELMACFAYDRKKFADKKITIGEGLIGTCFLEKQTIYITDVPNDYINITSGLGDAPPKSILIVPLKFNEEIFGIIELASFNIFEQNQIQFVEKIGESIASTISTVKINIKTSSLLEKSQNQTEILLQQEEEMRQNLEELHSTQDEILKRESEFTGIVNAIDNTIAKAELQLNGAIINLNEKFNKVFEIEKANLVNQNIKKFIYENQFDIFDNSFEIVSTGVSSDFTIKGHTSKNNDKWLLCSLTPVFDSNKQIDKVLFMANDITQQKNLEDELAKKDELQKHEIERLIHENNQKLEELHTTQEESIKREAELAAVLNGINQSLGTYEFDLNAKITTVNQKFLEQSGIIESDFIGESIIKFMPQDKHAAMNELVKKLFNGEKHSGAHQFKFNNEDKWFYETYTPVMALSGKYNKVIVLSNEITKSVLQERQLKEQTEELVSSDEELRQNLEEMKVIQEKIIKDAEEQKTRDAILIKEAKAEAQFHILNMEEDFFKKQKEMKKRLKEAALELEAAKNN